MVADKWSPLSESITTKGKAHQQRRRAPLPSDFETIKRLIQTQSHTSFDVKTEPEDELVGLAKGSVNIAIMARMSTYR